LVSCADRDEHGQPDSGQVRPHPFQTEFTDADAVVTAFLDKLAAFPNVQIIALSPEHAPAGLRDQVL
jgi:hypothetical protein